MKDNKLLADYLGEKVKEFTWKETTYLIAEHIDPICDPFFDFRIWCPNTNWNQLMRIVEKVEREVLTVGIDRNYCLIVSKKGEWKPIHIQESTKIEAVYTACVKYVKQQP